MPVCDWLPLVRDLAILLKCEEYVNFMFNLYETILRPLCSIHFLY